MNASRKSTVVLAAGGTGGHVFPALALASELARQNVGAALVTDERGSAHGGGSDGIDVHRVQAGGLAGKGVFARIRSVSELAIGTLQARRLLKSIAPDAVVGFGGYASVPTMLAARMAGIKTAIHEQNAILGRANRMLASKAAAIATSFEETAGLPPGSAPRVTHTGMPVRPAIAAMRDRDFPALETDGAINVLVLGGSQGAHVLSEVIPPSVGQLPDDIRQRLRMTQQCRPEDVEATEAAYRAHGIKAEIATFFADVPERLAATHLLIGRSGASTVAEVLTVGRPSILVPYPYAADDHQSFNAHAVADAGAGWLMPQNAFDPPALAARLQSLFSLPATLEKAAAAARSVGRADAAAGLAVMVSNLLPSGSKNNTRENGA
ncbi:MAG: undecaprenyldiphospho-muramoylpentapeptide beta-N-acetylglucosaminyltransferase [Rhodospirillales bacterium]|nr:undecaprenyldiphospho-muramoylpentapeptide beta-N-acetylglucosaminyltransferase [Rhodospirillales bacterium]